MSHEVLLDFEFMQKIEKQKRGLDNTIVPYRASKSSDVHRYLTFTVRRKLDSQFKRGVGVRAGNTVRVRGGTSADVGEN